MSVVDGSHGFASGWRGELSWVFVLLAVWAALDLTLDVSITSLLVCARFGWGDWVASCWLLKKDRVRTRGSACACFYLASALWKAALAAFTGSFVFLIFEGAILNRQEQNIDCIVLICCSLVGFSLCALLTTVGTMTAWRHTHRVWVDAAVHYSRENGIWPPCALDRNSARTLLTEAAIFWMAIVCLFVLVAILASINALGRNGPWLAYATAPGIIGTAISVLVLRNWIAARVVARVPHECWSEVPESWFSRMSS